MNKNHIESRTFSNEETAKLFRENGAPENQCGGCSFFAPLNGDWGLCLNSESAFLHETVFEHFGCEAVCVEHWGPHSFTNNTAWHCWCGGESAAEKMRTDALVLAEALEKLLLDGVAISEENRYEVAQALTQRLYQTQPFSDGSQP